MFQRHATLAVRERLAELHADDPGGAHAVERIALETCHRINRATPVTVTAVVCLALLAADRSLTLDEVLGTVAPLARYIEGRGWPVAGGVNLTDRATIRRTLQELVSSGVLSSYSAGTETIWGVGAQQHLVAAFYRNTAIHIFVDRAIGELSLVAAAETDGDAPQVAVQESLRLRDLLKFDFFFPGRAEFTEEMRAELVGIDPTAVDVFDTFSAADARRWLTTVRPYTAHLVLRPFVDAYSRLVGKDDRRAYRPAVVDGVAGDCPQWWSRCVPGIGRRRSGVRAGAATETEQARRER